MLYRSELNCSHIDVFTPQKFIYSNKTVKCRFLQDAIEEVEQEDVDAAGFVLTGPSTAGNVTD